ncbi:DUF1643 domain-containing protein [Cellulomonas humilata]|uniref:DUF1643 domain-containing protein n=1 Tax=Cellulomonas humilata TaxID=144055 RepID=UPI0034CEDE64
MIAGAPRDRQGEADNGAARLAVVCLNPPSSSTGSRTLGGVRRLADGLGINDTLTVNLLDVPSQSFDDFPTVGADELRWRSSREHLASSLEMLRPERDVVVAAWGLSKFREPSRSLLSSQIRWLVLFLDSEGWSQMHTFGGRPRHPSRWHQYVSDKYGRFSEFEPSERYAAALTSGRLSELL